MWVSLFRFALAWVKFRAMVAMLARPFPNAGAFNLNTVTLPLLSGQPTHGLCRPLFPRQFTCLCWRNAAHGLAKTLPHAPFCETLSHIEDRAGTYCHA